MPKSTKSLDIHTKNACNVAQGEYFVVASVSNNETVGLLIGTEVKKVREPEAVPSKYWRGNYWSVLVECPNGETRKIGCDVLVPRKTDKHFIRQAKMFVP